MKQIYPLLVLLLFSVAVRAEKGPKAGASHLSAQGSVQFKFNNVNAGIIRNDSVLLIFDRYDHTGAGVVYQVFYVDQDNNITLPAIPAGKYYVTVQCLGMTRDRIEKVITIKSQKNETVKISLQDSEAFSKDNVVIPVYKPNFANLAVLKSK